MVITEQCNGDARVSAAFNLEVTMWNNVNDFYLDGKLPVW